MEFLATNRKHISSHFAHSYSSGSVWEAAVFAGYRWVGYFSLQKWKFLKGWGFTWNFLHTFKYPWHTVSKRVDATVGQWRMPLKIVYNGELFIAALQYHHHGKFYRNLHTCILLKRIRIPTRMWMKVNFSFIISTLRMNLFQAVVMLINIFWLVTAVKWNMIFDMMQSALALVWNISRWEDISGRFQLNWNTNKLLSHFFKNNGTFNKILECFKHDFKLNL